MARLNEAGQGVHASRVRPQQVCDSEFREAVIEGLHLGLLWSSYAVGIVAATLGLCVALRWAVFA